jgi:hypothetical protein
MKTSKGKHGRLGCWNSLLTAKLHWAEALEVAGGIELRFDLGSEYVVLHAIAKATWAIPLESQFAVARRNWFRDCKNHVKMKWRSEVRVRVRKMMRMTKEVMVVECCEDGC